MNQFFEAFANMFRIPDLRKRLLFTLAMLAVYRLGAFLPTPGINTDVLAQFFPAESGLGPRRHRPVQRRQFPPPDDFRAGHHAVHYGVDHPATDAVVWPYLERLQKEGELGRRKITQYTRYLTILLSVVQSLSIAVTLEQHRRPEQSAAGLQPGDRVRADDHPDADHRLGVHHVAWRADYRARRRQRHVA